LFVLFVVWGGGEENMKNRINSLSQ